jgi:hypothetical protein
MAERVPPVSYPNSNMAYDSPYVLMCRILTLLQAFLTKTVPLRHTWRDVDKHPHGELFGTLTPSQAASFEALLKGYKTLVHEVVEGISTPTTPPEVVEVFRKTFDVFLVDDPVCLNTDIKTFAGRYGYRSLITCTMNLFHQKVDGVCTCLVEHLEKHSPVCIAVCMGSRPRYELFIIFVTFMHIPRVYNKKFFLCTVCCNVQICVYIR